MAERNEVDEIVEYIAVNVTAAANEYSRAFDCTYSPDGSTANQIRRVIRWAQKRLAEREVRERERCELALKIANIDGGRYERLIDVPCLRRGQAIEAAAVALEHFAAKERANG